MISAVINQELNLPVIRLVSRPISISLARYERLLRSGHQPAFDGSSSLGAALERVNELRSSPVAALTGMKVGDLISVAAAQTEHCRPGLIAPLTILRTQFGQLSPKVVIRVMDENEIVEDELLACHATYRRGGMEFMCITNRHLSEGYLYSRHFKLSFKAAYFSDPFTNLAVFCPTLRGWGIETWPA